MEPECRDSRGCHRVVPCDPGCAVGSRLLHEQLAAARNPRKGSGRMAQVTREQVLRLLNDPDRPRRPGEDDIADALQGAEEDAMPAKARKTTQTEPEPDHSAKISEFPNPAPAQGGRLEAECTCGWGRSLVWHRDSQAEDTARRAEEAVGQHIRRSKP